jgi:phage anti-repressor protein
MISIVSQDNKPLICSIELYKKAGYAPSKYSRWLKREIIDNSIKDIDYFDITGEVIKKRAPGYHGKKYLVTIQFAIAVCIMAKTESAKKLKFFLQNIDKNHLSIQ